MSRRRTGRLSNSPVLVGAVTVLITIVAVFLSYNANSGLPFVPTYDLKAKLPDAANLVEGNDVRIGGARGRGVEDHGGAEPQRPAERRGGHEARQGPRAAAGGFHADRAVRSALGLKYVELAPGSARAGLKAGSTVPLRDARPRPVEIDEVLNTFDARTRRGAQRLLNGLGTGLAGRGTGLNTAIEDLRPLLRDLQPVAANLAAPQTRLDRFFRSLGRAAAEVAPVAEEQAALFSNLDTTFTALASVARPFIQDTISQSPPTLDVGIHDFPLQRPFLRNSAALFRELRPGVRTLPSSAPVLADALEFGTKTLPKTPPFNRRLANVFDALARTAEDPLVDRGLAQLTRTARSLKPTLAFLTPAQTVCNYATLWFRNVSSLLSEGDANGTWQRFIIIATPQGPNNEGGPSSAPANGPDQANHLHANPYPNTAAPGQTRECEAGNEPFAVGRTVIGNLPGNQGTETSGQGGPSIASTGGGR